MKRTGTIVMLCAVAMAAMAQRADYAKMSPLVRKAAMAGRNAARKGIDDIADTRDAVSRQAASEMSGGRSICAFVRIEGDADKVLGETHCRKLAQFGNICIADIPVESLPMLSAAKGVKRIEAGRSNALCLDTMATVLNATKVYEGLGLPQAYTGKGVVVGLMDVGFDLTHPNFYDKDMQATRIRRFWDQLSPDSIGSRLYVGADYRTAADILAYGRSHDGLIETHGTHTLGIAAGTGFGTPYRGMAPDADICLVSNAVNTDVPLIPEDMLYKYTTATDALGFKYIFDYADEVGKPCVISFSEGSPEGLDGEQQLYYETLDAMTGKGKILVASAANNGHCNTYLHKPEGMQSDGVRLVSVSDEFSASAAGSKQFNFRLSAYRTLSPDADSYSHTVSTAQVLASPDSLFTDTLSVFGTPLPYQIQAYKTSLPDTPIGYDLVFSQKDNLVLAYPLSLEVVGRDADVQLFSNGVQFWKMNNFDGISGGEKKCCIASPAAAPAVICVGATAYRTGYRGLDGNDYGYYWGENGEVAGYSSVGPTRFGLCKPDVVAPGTFVWSSMSSFFVEEYPTGETPEGLGAYTEFAGRQYPWASFTGTSQSAPAVAGTIALWLEANPELTTADILNIFAATCRRGHFPSDAEKDNSRGYGEIDVYAGLLKVLGLDGIENVSMSQQSGASIIYKGGRTVEIITAEQCKDPADATLKVFSVAGKKVKELPVGFATHKAEVNIGGKLPPGVYLLQLSSSSPQCRGSVLVKIE